MAYDYEYVKVTVEDHVGTILLDRPKVNALNTPFFLEIGDAAVELDEDPNVRAIVVTGGPKVFAAGADIKQMAEYSAMEALTSIIGGAQTSLTRLSNVSKPTIAAVNGFALGGGCELALACDFRYGGEKTMMGVPEILLGIIPGAGGTQRLPRLIGPSKAKEMVFSGKYYKGAELLEYGVIDKLIEGDGEDVIAAATDFMRGLAQKSAPVALSMAKTAIDNGLNGSITDGLTIEAQAIAICFSTSDQKTGMRTFIEEGPGKAVFSGK